LAVAKRAFQGSLAMASMMEATPTLMTNPEQSWHSSKSIRSEKSRDPSFSRRSYDVEGGIRRLIKSGSDNSISSLDSEKIVRNMSKIPLRVRGRAEAWETPREQIEFLRKLGPGAGGEVWLCKWRGLKCAGKIVQDGVSSAAHEDMVNEISTMSHIRHPNLVMFLGAVSMSEPLVILTEFMEGGSIQARYDEQRKVLGKPWRPAKGQVVKWMIDVARAVCFLHKCGNPIVHRDLKPIHLLLTKDNVLKVTAYGLSKTLDRAHDEKGFDVDEAYAAPEVLNRTGYTEKADIYSMGMCFYFLVTGERPVDRCDGVSGPPPHALVPVT